MSKLRVSLSPLQKLIITLLLLVVISGALVFGFWQLVQRIGSSKTALADSKSRIAGSETVRASAGSLGAILKRRNGDIERIRGLFIARRDQPVEFFEAVEELARRTRTTVKTTVAQASGETKTLAFHMLITGREPDVRTLLKLLELMSYLVTADDISLDRTGSKVAPPGSPPLPADSVTLTLSLRVKTR